VALTRLWLIFVARLRRIFCGNWLRLAFAGVDEAAEQGERDDAELGPEQDQGEGERHAGGSCGAISLAGIRTGRLETKALPGPLGSEAPGALQDGDRGFLSEIFTP
jgi:hypothetical protein